MGKSSVEIRQIFLDFFYAKGHQILPSSSLVLENNSNLLFTNAGMNQFKDFFVGKEKSSYSKIVTAQRCVRAGGKHNDLDNVGLSTKHHTFFEMLGNFSFGNYFKSEAISYAWELLTSKRFFGLLSESLLVTVYESDFETYDIWNSEIGIPKERIVRIGDNKNSIYTSDNFWQMGDVGPCGPCTEIFYDRGDHLSGTCSGSFEKNGDRYVEIWNIVFIQFIRQVDGSLLKLPNFFVDTGMGLERISAVLQNVNSNYEIDIFKTLHDSIINLIEISIYNQKSLYVIMDHIRSCSFLISDGVFPSNEKRGYVLRRIIRRAIRYGRLLGIKEPFFYKLVSPLIKSMGKVAENIKSQQKRIEEVLKTEEEQFSKTLERGLVLLEEELEKIQGNTLDGNIVFRLYNTFGFPIELTKEICRERNLSINEEEIEKAVQCHRNQISKTNFFSSKNRENLFTFSIGSKFNGYDCLNLISNVVGLYIAGKSVDQVLVGQDAVVALNETSFYGESSGQIGDIGILKGKNSEFIVKNSKKYFSGVFHIGRLSFGRLRIGDSVKTEIDLLRRNCISANHSATHLLHSALRLVLGTHVVQKGSFVHDKYLRFDFFHFKEMTLEELWKVEKTVNLQIRNNLNVSSEITTINSAKQKGAIALFEEKYREYVRVLNIGKFSKEFCNGTHVNCTGEIGFFYISGEFGIGSNIRRIEALTGERALEKVHEQRAQLYHISKILKVNNYDLDNKVSELKSRVLCLEKELKCLHDKQIVEKSALLSTQVIQIKGINLLVAEISISPKMLHVMVANLKNKLGSGVIVLATIVKTKISLIVGITRDLTDRIRACDLVIELAGKLGGNGGGRSDMAQGGGVDVKGLHSILGSVKDWVNDRL